MLAFEEPHTMAIGNRISALLGERRENITDFARNLGVSYTTAHGLYHGTTKSISFELIGRICDYFNKSPNEVFPWTPSTDAAAANASKQAIKG